MQRRTFFLHGTAGTLAAAASGCTVLPHAGGPRPAPVVLVHGAWHGGWCWTRVAARLRAAGHEVFAPTLTGVGDRSHLAAGVTLDTHITDIQNLIEAEELSGVVLVGHSYAGMVITGVADRMAGRLKRLVYLDAFVPTDGAALIDYLAAERRPAMVRTGESTGYLPPLPAQVLGVTDPGDAAWVTRRVTRQPYATFAQPIHLRSGGGSQLPRTYVYCSSPPSGSFDAFAARFRADPAWRYHELRTGHDCMVTDPAGVARLVQQAA